MPAAMTKRNSETSSPSIAVQGADFAFSQDPGPWDASPRDHSFAGTSLEVKMLFPVASIVERAHSDTAQAHESNTPGSAGSGLTATDLAFLSNNSGKASLQGMPDMVQLPVESNNLNSLLTQRPQHTTKLHRSTTANTHASSTDCYSASPSRSNSPPHILHARPFSPAHSQGTHLASRSISSPQGAPALSEAGVGLQGHNMLAVRSPRSSGRKHRATVGEVTDWHQHYPQQSSTRNQGPVDPVDQLLGRYHATQQMPLALHLRTQRHIGQLKQYQAIKEQMQLQQSAMLDGVGAVQGGPSPYPQDMPSTSTVELRQTSQRNATKGSGAPSVNRFNSKSILQEGMYVSSGDYSFAATLPMRNNPSASLLFERYAGSDEGVPQVQRFYMRPDRPARPRSPPTVSYPSRSPPSGRRLPNGIPVCRLATEQAIRKSKITDGYGHTKAENSAPIIGPGFQQPTMDQQVADAVTSLGGHDMGEPTTILTPRTGNAASVLTTLGAASSLGVATCEPVLDDPFAALVKSHFSELAKQQSQRLQRRLNAGLPVILSSMGVSSECLATK